MVSVRHDLAEMLGERAVSRRTLLYRGVEAALVLAGIVAMVAGTSEGAGPGERRLCLAIDMAVLLCFGLDWLAHLWVAPLAVPALPAGAARRRWLHSRWGLIGLACFVPMAIAAPFAWSPEGAPLFAVLWVLRFARYSKGIDMLLTVLAREREAVIGVLFMFLTMLLICAVLGFLAERRIQPQHFGSMSMALWWSIATLTTTGYGDFVPLTAFGRLLAGLMMISGIVVFGLLAGILASGFFQEVRRREFLRNWDLVHQVPMFRDIGPATIADLAALLRPRDLPARAILCRRGQPGDAMFFIVSGEVEVLLEPKPLRLGGGEFFGEIALLSGSPRNATVATTRETQLLALDIADFRALAASRPELLRLIQLEADRRAPAALPGERVEEPPLHGR